MYILSLYYLSYFGYKSTITFILSLYYYDEFQSGGKTGFVNHFVQAEKTIVDCDCAFSCVHVSCFHTDVLCVLRELHADSPVRAFT